MVARGLLIIALALIATVDVQARVGAQKNAAHVSSPGSNRSESKLRRRHLAAVADIDKKIAASGFKVHKPLTSEELRESFAAGLGEVTIVKNKGGKKKADKPT